MAGPWVVLTPHLNAAEVIILLVRTYHGEGDILLDGKSIRSPGTNPSALRARIGTVFQSFELLPHRTAPRSRA